MAGKGVNWSLDELVDFEISLTDDSAPNTEIGQEMRKEMRATDALESDLAKRRWGLKYWMRWVTSKKDASVGHRVVTISQILGVCLFLFMMVAGVGVVRGLLTEYSYESGPYLIEGHADSRTGADLSTVDRSQVQGQQVKARGFNLWVFLAVTLGLQWLLIIGSLLGFLLFQKWSLGLKGILSGLMKRFVGGVGQSQWAVLLGEKKSQRSALTWRLSRILQLGGIGYNAGLLAGLFGLLWFSSVGFFWESTLPMGAPSLEKTTQVLAAPWGGERPSEKTIELTELRTDSDNRYESEIPTSVPLRSRANLAWAGFLFLAIGFWGLLPRFVFLVISVWKEKSLLSKLDFQDRAYRSLWRELSHVERSVAMEGLQDGVVLCDVGGIEVETEALRPFLLQTLRVNPEARFSVDVLDQAEEQAAWLAMRDAPCGIVILVEGWNLSPKQFTALWKRIRREAGNDTVIRVLILGDLAGGQPDAPKETEVAEWRNHIDPLRDPLMECLAYDANSLRKE
ncbi:MAG: DUF2868 domain-containing protein [Akkermansiaceae bacterium]